MISKNLTLAAAVTVLAFAAGCDTNEGPAEKAGAKVDHAVESAGDKMGEAMDKAGDKLEDAGDAIKDKTDN